MEGGKFIALLEKSLASNAVLSAFLNCEATYSGRAETFLPRGDRLVVIKADNTVLIHQPEGNNPINYMKQGSEISAEMIDGRCMLRIRNAKEKSWLDLEVFEVFSATAKKLVDGQKMDLAGSERDMSDFIRDNPNIISKDFKPIKREEQTDVGFIDVFGHDGNGGLVVVECKRVTAPLSAVDQLRRYVDRVKEIKGTEKVSGIMAAPGITPNAKEMLLSWGFTFVEVQAPARLERWQKDQKSLVEF